MPDVGSSMGSECRESAGQQLGVTGRPEEGGSARLQAAESRRGVWLLVKKKKKGCACVRLAAQANEKRGRAEPVQEAASRDRGLRGGACVPESG